jgi:ABC-type multidrug transport system ATPase subunit
VLKIQARPMQPSRFRTAAPAGMKRRLSVAISLIGSPKVAYLDEPSTGLDPAARRNLWGVVKAAKAGKAVILTTHSMEEAEVLCDRLGIFVGGRLICVGNPKQLTTRYGGYYVRPCNVFCCCCICVHVTSVHALRHARKHRMAALGW